MNRVNRSEMPLEKGMENILLVGRHRPVVIQSLFPRVLGEEPPPEEIDEFILRLNDLKLGGAHFAGADLFGEPAHRASRLRHLPLKTLSHISQRIKAETG